MDLRVERTRRNIINAFIALRSRKPLEKISIKELAEAAQINKATFYSHYHDIYDLSEQLEKETIDNILSCIPHPEELLNTPKQATEMLAVAFLSQSRLINILFADNRSSNLINCVEERLKNMIYTACPETKENLELDIMLSYLIQGSFHVFLYQSGDVPEEQLIALLGKMNEKILDIF